jgi:hypothetical protein
MGFSVPFAIGVAAILLARKRKNLTTHAIR